MWRAFSMNCANVECWPEREINVYHTVLKERIRQQHLLHSAMLELTYSCNLDCFFCYNDVEAQGRPLSPQQYINLLDDLADMGVLFLTLTGGEPLAHPQFFEIGKAASERGFAIRVKSNGHALRGAIARRLHQEVNPLDVEISLHGASAAVHDQQTRVPGSFERLVSNIPEMLEIGLRVSVVSTLTSWNEHEVSDMFALCDLLKIKLRWQGPVSPRDNGDQEPLKIQPSASSWGQLQQIAEHWHGDGDEGVVQECGAAEGPGTEGEYHHCEVGTGDLLIDPYGNVHPCLHLRWAAGNLHQQGVREIWEASSSFGKARKLSIATAKRFENTTPNQFGAPIFCPGVERKFQGEKPEVAVISLESLKAELRNVRRSKACLITVKEAG